MNATHTTAQRIPSHETAARLIRLLELAGYSEGAPPRIRPESIAIDRASCRRGKCHHCGQRGMAYRPFHNAEGRYRVLAVCSCGHGSQV